MCTSEMDLDKTSNLLNVSSIRTPLTSTHLCKDINARLEGAMYLALEFAYKSHTLFLSSMLARMQIKRCCVNAGMTTLMMTVKGAITHPN